jgi:hypothetical protein
VNEVSVQTIKLLFVSAYLPAKAPPAQTEDGSKKQAFHSVFQRMEQ